MLLAPCTLTSDSITTPIASGNRIKFPIGMFDPTRAETESEKASETKIGAASIFLLTFSLHPLLLLSSFFHQELDKTKRGSVVSSSPSLIYAAFFLSFVLNSPPSANCPVISIYNCFSVWGLYCLVFMMNVALVFDLLWSDDDRSLHLVANDKMSSRIDKYVIHWTHFVLLDSEAQNSKNAVFLQVIFEDSMPQKHTISAPRASAC